MTPAFVRMYSDPMDRAFVCRDRQLERLNQLLDLSLDGKGQFCLITGEAGVGKTSLTAEFAQRAEQAHENLLVTIGDCNSQTGIGDPYLPFREVLGMLAGDIDDRLAQGMTTRENANRLRGFLNTSSRVIKEVGPDLIDIFVPGVGIATRATALVAAKQSAGDGENKAPTFRGSQDADQTRIFEQMTRVFVTLSQQRPLVLVLDDLHWIDPSSASLLFHLARRIEGSRILVIGTYRPEEVAIGRGGSIHPMSQVVAETKRLYGDIVIELSNDDEAEGRELVETLLDNESNDFSDAFRKRLYEQTLGHPLFTAELLRHMCDTGALTKNEAGNWVEGPGLDWDVLPARTEGAIEQRVIRLGDEQREVLSVGAVQGPVFIAELVARVLDRPERRVITLLVRELGQVHRLVREEGTKRFGSQRLSSFRFTHQLFQKYLYDRLGASERQLFHEDIGNTLETLYADRTDAVAGRLAYHFEEAQLPARAAAYYRQAADRAIRVLAYREAARLAEKGIALLERGADAGDTSALKLQLHLALGEAEHHCGRYTVAMDAFREAAEGARRTGDAEAAAIAALGYSEPGWRYNLVDATTGRLLRDALRLLGDEDSALRSRVLANIGAAVRGSESDAVSMKYIDEATDMARRLDDPQAIVDCIRLRLHLDRDPRRVHDRLQLADEALRLSRELDEANLELEARAFKAYDLTAIGEVDKSDAHIDVMMQLADRLGDPFYIYHASTLRVAQLILRGEFENAERQTMQALQTGQQLGVDHAEGVMGLHMFTIRREQGRLQEIAPVLEQFVSNEGADSAWRPGLTLLYSDLGRWDDARENFNELAKDRFAAVPRDSLWQTCLAYLAETCCALGDTDRAGVLFDLLLPYEKLALVVGNHVACLGATSRLLGQLAAVLEDWDAAERHFEHALVLNESMNATPSLVRTRHHFACMLERRGRDDDAARAAYLAASARSAARTLGMTEIAETAGKSRGAAG